MGYGLCLNGAGGGAAVPLRDCCDSIGIGMIHSIINRICKRIDISVLYETEAGIKCLNNISSHKLHRYFSSGGIQIVPAERLYMCMDRLKDPYTLLYANIMDSPHFELMQILRDGGDVMRSSYVQRFIKGTLDPRSPARVDHRHVQYLQKTFEKKRDAIRAGTYTPVKIIVVSGQYFVGDGRHTAALCALENIAPKCIDISPVVYDTYNWWCYRKMLKAPDHYKKHIKFFEAILATDTGWVK